MTIFDSIIQGIVQGLTEFLPVSSSGHLTIAQHFLGIRENNLLFDVALHLGTLISVIFVYHKIIFKLFFSFFSLPVKILSKRRLTSHERLIAKLAISLVPLLFLFVPISGVGNLKSMATKFSESGDIAVVGFSLIATSFLLIAGVCQSKILSSSKRNSLKGFDEMSGFDSFLMGIAQLFAAVFPGLSRSGSTLSIGLLQGIKREVALDFSFLMGTPAIVAAAVLEFREAKDLGLKLELIPTLVGVGVSATVGFLSIKFFKWMISKDRTWIFAVYCLLMGMSILITKRLFGI